jgi:hypothetical protein
MSILLRAPSSPRIETIKVYKATNSRPAAVFHARCASNKDGTRLMAHELWPPQWVISPRSRCQTEEAKLYEVWYDSGGANECQLPIKKLLSKESARDSSPSRKN